MSHFCGFVITTPKYNLDIEDSLEPYNEQLKLPMHKVLTKEQIIEKGRKNIEEYKESWYKEYLKDPEAYKAKRKTPEHIKYISEEFPKKLEWTDEQVYEDNISSYREDINNGATWCEIHEDGSLWKTTNENAKWDWFTIGGRWDAAIKTKAGDYVNTCKLGEIDWTPFKDEDYEKEEKEDFFGRKYRPLKEGVEWHFTKEDTPFCVVIDGDWNEKAEMGWWGVTSNEKDDWRTIFFELIGKLPADSEVTLVDFHI
jgi:hypothetical protein